MNAAMPRGLYWAQVGLYLWAAYDLVWTAVGVWAGSATGATLMQSILFGIARALAAYGVSNEGKWGYWLGLIVCGTTIMPALNEVVHRLSLLLHPDFLVLIVLPVAIFFSLLEASSRDYERTWFR